MKWLLDTNVVSEFKRPAPSQKVMGWFRRQPVTSFHTSVIVLAELGHGIASAPDSAREDLAEWLDLEIRPLFAERVFVVDELVARAALSVLKAARLAGRTFPATDLLIGATAAVHGLTVVTRNERDFAGTGAPLFNPWSA